MKKQRNYYRRIANEALSCSFHLKNIESIQFSDQIVEESKVDVIKRYSGEFSDYKFYNKDNGKYEIQTDSGYDDITGLPLLTFFLSLI
tara:strand:+ start:194 stop:457 length:264 start_codon:yes stop_codon:yes gene_type:complete